MAATTAAGGVGGGGAPVIAGGWPEELAEHVKKESGGKLRLAEDEEVGRHLVAAEELPAHRPVLCEWSLFSGSDEAPALRLAALPGDAEGMVEALERPSGGGSNPLAHFDLFGRLALDRLAARGDPRAAERVDRLARWFCRPSEGDGVDREAQAEKLQMLYEALRPELRAATSLEDLKRFDDVLMRNAEEFTGAPTVLGSYRARDGRPPCFGRRRYQGIFPCKDLIQHSCEPNCMTVAGMAPPEEPSSKEPASLRLSMQIVPLRTIAAGEQLSWCYLPYWKQLWPTQLRRRALQESWHFHCRCPRCAGDAPERVMAFRCPACSCGELCPAAPCAGDDGHVSALASVAALVCGGCGLKLERGGGSHAGYLERCLAQEGAVFALPWREVLGRDLAAAGPGGLDLLAESHWLLVDTASHELENAPAILKAKGFVAVGADLGEVRRLLQQVAKCADTIASGLRRLLRHERHVALPELLLTKALCTGEQRDFDAYWEAQRVTFADLRFAEGFMKVATVLRDSRRGFFADVAARPSRDGALALGTVLEHERTRLETWVSLFHGADAEEAGADDGPDGLPLWALRRMWLCPDLGWIDAGDEEGEEESERETDEEVEVDSAAPDSKRPRLSR